MTYGKFLIGLIGLSHMILGSDQWLPNKLVLEYNYGVSSALISTTLILTINYFFELNQYLTFMDAEKILPAILVINQSLL